MGIDDGANYAPEGTARAVVEPGEFKFAVACLDHGHINGQTNGLIEAGGTLTHVYDPDPKKVSDFCDRYPAAAPADSIETLLEDTELALIASAAIPNRRAALGLRVLRSGKNYFTDKSPFTTLEQLAEVRAVVEETGQRYFVYFSERLHNEAAWRAGELIHDGAIGEVLHVTCLAPHRLSAATRPEWFFDKEAYGGIITDIGSHQVEQFLTYAGCDDATVNFARVRNCTHPEYPGLEDFGEFSLTGSTGAGFYSRVDWYTPDGLEVWGDGRTFIVGSKGTLEVRKYVDLGRTAPASRILWTNADGTDVIDCLGEIGYPFFGQMILDSLHGSEKAMSQAHIFKSAEISMRAQELADTGERE